MTLRELYKLQQQIKTLQKIEKEEKARMMKAHKSHSFEEDGLKFNVIHVEESTKIDYKSLVNDLNPSNYMIKKHTSKKAASKRVQIKEVA